MDSDICPTCKEPFDNGKHIFGAVHGTYLCNHNFGEMLNELPQKNAFPEEKLWRLPIKSPFTLLTAKLGTKTEDDSACPYYGHKRKNED